MNDYDRLYDKLSQVYDDLDGLSVEDEQIEDLIENSKGNLLAAMTRAEELAPG